MVMLLQCVAPSRGSVRGGCPPDAEGHRVGGLAAAAAPTMPHHALKASVHCLFIPRLLIISSREELHVCLVVLIRSLHRRHAVLHTAGAGLVLIPCQALPTAASQALHAPDRRHAAANDPGGSNRVAASPGSNRTAASPTSSQPRAPCCKARPGPASVISVSRSVSLLQRQGRTSKLMTMAPRAPADCTFHTCTQKRRAQSQQVALTTASEQGMLCMEGALRRMF